MFDRAPTIPSLADDIRLHFATLPQSEALQAIIGGLEHVTKAKLQTANAYAASGAVVSPIFYSQVQCHINNGRHFTGKSWDACFHGSGALCGDIYLEPHTTLEGLYLETRRCHLIATPDYTAIGFYGGPRHLLALMLAGAISDNCFSFCAEGYWF